jgi:hypothetical protein
MKFFKFQAGAGLRLHPAMLNRGDADRTILPSNFPSQPLRKRLVIHLQQ